MCFYARENKREAMVDNIQYLLSTEVTAACVFSISAPKTLNYIF